MSRLGRASIRIPALIAVAAVAIPLASCGGGEPQDASEPSGDYPVDVFKATFPNRQRLAETSDLVIGVANTGDQTIPEIAVTMFIADENGEPSGNQPFTTQIDQPGVADPNRPVWIVEDKYPVIEGFPLPKGSSPGTVAQTNTYGFGELAPDARIEMIWRLAAVRAGTHTVNYEISAGLYGHAKAVTSDGSTPEGQFIVTITDQPPKARVNAQGDVVISTGSNENNRDEPDEPGVQGE